VHNEVTFNDLKHPDPVLSPDDVAPANPLGLSDDVIADSIAHGTLDPTLVGLPPRKRKPAKVIDLDTVNRDAVAILAQLRRPVVRRKAPAGGQRRPARRRTTSSVATRGDPDPEPPLASRELEPDELAALFVRHRAAIKLLTRDRTVDPADALASVVWPSAKLRAASLAAVREREAA
jgi:hypothetical protein